jgi:hypothetical protein
MARIAARVALGSVVGMRVRGLSRLSSHSGEHLGPNRAHDEAYWIAAYRSPHVEIKWQELPEQREQVKALTAR